MDWFRAHYVPDDATALDPRVSPLLAPDVGGLPRARLLKDLLAQRAAS
jgi:acetyl esterase